MFNLNIAHYLTFLRLIISPLFLFIYIEQETLNIAATALPWILLFLFIVSEISDAFDGYFARKYNQVTDLGKIMDPIADSIYRITIFLAFTLPPIQLPLYLIFVFIYRDMLISALRTVCALKGFALAARPSGKIKAIIQAIAAFILIVMLIPFSQGYLSQESLHKYATSIVSFAAIYAIFSGIEYVYANRLFIRRIIEN